MNAQTNENKEIYIFGLADRRWFAASLPGERCLICYKPLKADCDYVEISIDGCVFGTSAETESQGCFGIGPECARKHGIPTRKIRR